jgi:elongation factor P
MAIMQTILPSEFKRMMVLVLDGTLMDVVMPPQIPLKVLDTAAPIRGGSDSAWKEAKMETGLQIMVPLFIAKGETIRVDTAAKKYAGREAAEK